MKFMVTRWVDKIVIKKKEEMEKRENQAKDTFHNTLSIGQ